MPSVKLTRIAKRFGETRALVDANLEAMPGEIHAIVGENGSGKSTLAKIVSGVLAPDAGDVDVLGRRPQSPRDAIEAGVATIYQEILLGENLSIKDNLFAGSDGFWRRRRSDRAKRTIAKDYLERLTGAAVEPDALVGPLPLSLKQWIVIARALIQAPRLLIFDESSAALDLDATRRLHEEMRRLRAQGCCILLVTHRIAELVKIADAATVLRDGITVGRLGREEITEARLLDLMSASTVVDLPRPAAARAARPPALRASGLVLRPGGPPLDFEIGAGEIVGLTGLEGAGHERFARTLAGIEPKAAGELVALGEAPRPVAGLADAAQARIAYVSGDRKREGLFPKLSIVENFGMALMARHSRAGLIDTQRRARDFATQSGRLSIKFGQPVDRITTLSGGNQQKVLIARAFAQDPRIIVLNDPARGVDIGAKQDLYRHLRAFAETGGAVVYLSSEIEEFLGFADRVDVFFEGRIFERLSGGAIHEHRILSALFGRRAEIEFDAVEESAG
jgi:ribose transport system ATP-binding protein